MKRTNFWVLIFIFTCLLPIQSLAIELGSGDKGTIKFTGFLKMDMSYQDAGMNSYYAPRYALDNGSDGELNFTAMHSRFGLKWTGLELDNGIVVGGTLEWDLFGASRNQMQFRTRHAFMTLKKDGSTFLFGQTWDVFSPLGPTTLMTNGYLWQVGNLGFRRAQARYTYSSGGMIFAVSVNDPTTDGGLESKTPMVESRIGFAFGDSVKAKVGLSGAYAKDDRSAADINNEVTVSGFSLDWMVNFTKNVAWKGEFATGQNLGVFLSRGKVYFNETVGKYDAVDVDAYWTELVVKNGPAMFWLGYSTEQLTTDAQLAMGAVQDTQCMFGGVQYSLGGGVFLAAEVANFKTDFLGGTDTDTSQMILSAIYKF